MRQRQEPSLEDPELRIVMADYQAGSAAAFERLHDALAPDLKAYLTMLARDATRADDLLQETFLQIHRSRAAHTPGEPVKPWVFAIARRVFLLYRRSASRRTHYESLSSMPGATPGTTEADRLHARQEIDRAMRHVPSAGRRAFVLHHVFGLSFKEVATRLGITPGAAKIRSSRAATLMRSLLRGGRDE
jgi:RNA polymerase sigma-70 factor (ECF subfamily)